MTYTLQLLHASDLEGGVDAIDRAANFATIVDIVEDDFANSITISAGDNYIPGPFFSTAADFSMGGILSDAYARILTEIEGVDLTGVTLDLGRGGGRVDVTIMNAIGFDASAVGNHEFDPGPSAFRDIIASDGGGGVIEWPGAGFPYLTANIDFSASDLSGNFTSDILMSSAYKESVADLAAGNFTPDIAPSTLIEENGELIGVVGATTQIIETISSTGGANEITGGANDMAALAAALQPEIDALVLAGANKIIVTSHLQQFAFEQELATLLDHVDIIIAGGSDTRLANAGDRLRPGDSSDGDYPFLTTNASGDPVAIVSTDGEYSYVGRLIVEFNDQGILIDGNGDPLSDIADLDPLSGAYVADDQGAIDAIGAVAGALSLATSEAQEVPPVADTPATGTFNLYVEDSGPDPIVVIEGTFENLSSPLLDVSPEGVDPEGNPIDSIHLHNAAAGLNGPVVRALTVTDNMDGSGSYFGRFTLTASEFAELEAGNLYINIHTDNNPGGELRGQLPDSGGIATVAVQSGEAAVALSTKGDIVNDLTTAVQDIVAEKDAITFGEHEVFLDGRRETVRTEESNLGNVTADANLAAARAAEAGVDVSFKNGGGIRAPIGSATNEGTDAGDGVLSQLDLENALRFNNELTLVTLSTAAFLQMLEHGVAETEPGATPGRFPQISGFRFSFDATQPAQELTTDVNGNYVIDPMTGLPEVATEGGRVQTVSLVAEDGTETIIVRDGDVVDGAPAEVRMVTLNFLVENNGDGYPFLETATNILYLTEDGGTTADGSADNLLGEQTAMADFFTANFPNEDSAFDDAETDVFNDRRIVQLAENGGNDRLLAAEPDPTIAITLVQELQSGETELFTGGSEVVATEAGVAYVTNGAQDRIDVFDIASGMRTDTLDLSFVDDYDGVQSVAVKNGIVAAAVAREGALDGVVLIFDTDGMLLNEVTVGNLPDMVTFTPDGTKILVANEGEPVDATTDPEGSVSIIDLSSGAANTTVTTADFQAFDGQEDALRDAGVLIEPGNNASEDLEPEYIAVTPDGSTAWVALQEANAYGVLDIASATFTSLETFGTVDRSMVPFDASNRDNAINLQTYDNVHGMRQPDAIHAYEVGGQTYVFTANEGDARDATEARVADLTLDPTAFPNADILQLDENLGRQNVRTDLGDTDNDGDYDELYVYGGRSFTIYDTSGGIVFDSATQFETLIAEIRPDLFNQDEGDFDDRSDDKGVEPEAIAVGEVGGRVLTFVGLERDNGVFVYDVSNPSAPEYVTYIDSEANGNISPETIAFVPAADSTSGKAQILVAYEGDGNTVVYDVETVIPAGQRIVGTNQNDNLIGGDGSDTINGLNGDDTLIGGETDRDLADLIIGGNGSDSADGGAGNDVIYGMNGEDTLIGGLGSDTLVGQNGKDVLNGGAISDLLVGGNGSDFLNGGFGSDELRGGEAPDTFYHAAVSGHGTDWIQDFANNDELFIGVAGVAKDDFALNIAETPRSGQAGVSEAFVGLKTTGQTLFALVDGEDLSSIMVRTLSGDTFDLLG